MRHIFTIILYTITTLTISPSLVADDALPLSTVMTPEEMRETGVATLPAAKRKALEEWLSRWTLMVLNQSSTYRSATPVSEWVDQWPAYARPVQPQNMNEDEEEQLNQERAEANRKIDKIKDEGATIELKDGSVWLVSPFDRFRTRLWQRNDSIEIGKSRNVMRPYRLKNMTRSQFCEAEMQRPASPTGEAPQEGPEYYEGAVGIQEVRMRGEYLLLEDKTYWRIAPVDQMSVRRWRTGDRIKAVPSNNFIFKYTLNNLDSGGTALANKVDSNE